MNDLRQHMNFTAADLEANRAGHLSPRQQTRLMRGAWAGAAVIALVTLASGFLILSASSLLWAAVFALLMVIVGRVAFHQRRQAVQNSKVIMAEGLARIEYRSNVRGAAYILTVSDTAFIISPTASRLIDEGATYRAYHLPNERRILSIERIVEA